MKRHPGVLLLLVCASCAATRPDLKLRDPLVRDPMAGTAPPSVITRRVTEARTGDVTLPAVAVPTTSAQEPDDVLYQVQSSVDIELHGFVRIDYGAGKHYPKEIGRDQLGISKMALETHAKWDNYTFIAALGSTILSDDPDAPGNSIVDTSFKDLFVVIDEVGGSQADLSVGAQPLLFGLKPAGYPGDRTILPSIEFGGSGAFAVSNQAGAAAVADYPLGDVGSIQVGLFDTSSTTFGAPVSADGSSLYKNYFGQVRLDSVDSEGLYGVIGLEGLYVGGAVDDTEPITDIGVGYKQGNYDVSLEYIRLDENITSTADDESYVIAELTVSPSDRWELLADYATADELDTETVRLGARFDVQDHVYLQLEFAHDDIDGSSDLDSVLVRLAGYF